MTIRFKSLLTFAGAAALSAGSFSALVSDANAQWQPTQPVEFIIMAGTGGGADQLARYVQALIEQKDLSPVPFIPINKGGGSGAEALRYMEDNAGDNHKILVTLNSFYTTPLLQEDLGVDVSTFTPIGLMGIDTFLLWVTADSPITTLDEYAAAVSAAGGSWIMGGTGSGQEDSILTAMLEAEFGFDVTYVPFPGGGTVAAELIGEHINSTVNNPAEQNEYYRAGQSKPLVQFTEERTEAYPDIPTARELGHDIVYYMQRSINGPPGMDPEAQQFYTDLFGAIFASDEWQEYCSSEGLGCDEYLAGDDLAAFHAAQLERHRALIEEVGAAAITGE